jgi:hypothetical protein
LRKRVSTKTHVLYDMPVVVSFVGSDILVKEYGYFVKSVFFFGGGGGGRVILKKKKFIF